MAEGIENSKHLRHGDIVALVCDGPPGYDGFLSSSSSSVKEVGSDLRVSYEPTIKLDAGAFSPEFQSTSLWRVDSSTGEGAPGKQRRRLGVGGGVKGCARRSKSYILQRQVSTYSLTPHTHAPERMSAHVLCDDLGKPVIFGNTVRLHLLRSRQFLKSTSTPTKENKRNYCLDLSRAKTKDCQFHILPQLK
jgi:hypothetical protein